MSATRLPRVTRADFYRTPAWAVRAIVPTLLERVPVSGSVLDAGAGEGHIGIALAEGMRDRFPTVTGIELDASLCHVANRVEGIKGIAPGWCVQGDFLTVTPGTGFNAVVMNPPFSQARAFVENAIRIAAPVDGIVVALLRLNWLAGVGRADFHRAHPCELFVLSRRPSFTGKGTDAADYAWFVWDTKSPATGITILGGGK